jgi:NAD(P)-dependent dehydrogenase (short-subunit alcohol dehydrogenase family)
MADTSIVLITGGNTGIGYESIKALYASPQAHTILMGSRSLEKAKEAIFKLQTEVADSKSEVVPIQIDIEDDASIAAAVKEVESKHGHIDTLLNNAGRHSIRNETIDVLILYQVALSIFSCTPILVPKGSEKHGTKLLTQRHIHPSLHSPIHELAPQI